MGLGINDIVMVSFDGRCLNQRVLFTQFLRVAQPTSATISEVQDLKQITDDMAGGVGAPWMDRFLALKPGNYVLRAIRAQRIYPVPRSVYVETGVNLTGLWEGLDAETVNLAGVLTFKTDFSGRSQVSNKHIGPLPNDAYSLGTLGASLKTDMGDFGDTVLSGFVSSVGTNLKSGIYHKDGDGAANKWDSFTSWQIGDTVRVMRRRTVGLGE